MAIETRVVVPIVRSRTKPSTLYLTIEANYLSHVSRGLEFLDSYRQVARSVTTRPDELRETLQVFELASTGERGSRDRSEVVPGTATDGGRYDRLGRDVVVEASGTAALACHLLPDGVLQADHFPPMVTGVSDATAFRSATLLEAGVEVHGFLNDRYRLEPPPSPAFDVMAGEVWLTRDGQLVVRYLVEATRGDITFERSYDLEAPGALVALTLLEACAVP